MVNIYLYNKDKSISIPLKLQTNLYGIELPKLDRHREVKWSINGLKHVKGITGNTAWNIPTGYHSWEYKHDRMDFNNNEFNAVFPKKVRG